VCLIRKWKFLKSIVVEVNLFPYFFKPFFKILGSIFVRAPLAPICTRQQILGFEKSALLSAFSNLPRKCSPAVSQRPELGWLNANWMASTHLSAKPWFNRTIKKRAGDFAHWSALWLSCSLIREASGLPEEARKSGRFPEFPADGFR
jgi:hypothetical protein